MKIIVGSPSDRKVNVVSSTFSELLPNESISVIKCDVNSGVPETPWGEQTKQGAINRAKQAMILFPNEKYFIGLESGLVNRYHDIFEEAWACIIDDKNNTYLGYSSGLALPKYIVNKIADLPHSKVMEKLQKNSLYKKGETWGLYSKGMLSRDIGLCEAVRNALVQVLAKKD